MIDFNSMYISCSPIIIKENGKKKEKTFSVHFEEPSDGPESGRFADILIPYYQVTDAYRFDKGEQIDMLKYCWDNRGLLLRLAESRGSRLITKQLINSD